MFNGIPLRGQLYAVQKRNNYSAANPLGFLTSVLDASFDLQVTTDRIIFPEYGSTIHWLVCIYASGTPINTVSDPYSPVYAGCTRLAGANSNPAADPAYVGLTRTTMLLVRQDLPTSSINFTMPGRVFTTPADLWIQVFQVSSELNVLGPS